MMELRLTVGEIAFAVGVVSTIDRALDIVGEQLGAREPERARMALAASGQSLLARELASHDGRDVKLAPQLQSAAEIIAGAEWMLRCVRVAGKRTDQLLFHIAPTGVLAQRVEGLVVHRVAGLADVAALVDRAAALFGLAPIDQLAPPVRLPRDVVEELARMPARADVARELTVRGMPEAMSYAFATDLAAPSWKGALSLDHTPKGQPAHTQSALFLFGGARRWQVATYESDAAALGEASHQRLGVAIKDVLRTVDSTTRKFDRAGQLDS